MERNPVIEYLHKEISVAKSKLRDAQSKKQLLDDEIKHLESEIRDLNSHLRSLNDTFDKALKDFKINPSEYDFNKSYAKRLLDKLNTTNTIADSAYLVLKKNPYAMHISELTGILVSNNLISTRSENPIPIVTSALMRDKDRFNSLGKGRWEINKESSNK